MEYSGQLAKALIRLRKRAGWLKRVIVAVPHCLKSHVAAKLYYCRLQRSPAAHKC